MKRINNIQFSFECIMPTFFLSMPTYFSVYLLNTEFVPTNGMHHFKPLIGHLLKMTYFGVFEKELDKLILSFPVFEVPQFAFSLCVPF